MCCGLGRNGFGSGQNAVYGGLEGYMFPLFCMHCECIYQCCDFLVGYLELQDGLDSH